MTQELLDYFNQDELAATVWLTKYKDADERTPDDMHRRLARRFYDAERQVQHEETFLSKDQISNLSDLWHNREIETEESIYNYLANFRDIIPQGSVMSGLGINAINSLSNCFVIGQPVDSYGGIFLKDQEQVQLMKRRGGVGQDLSKLRPAGVETTNSAKYSTGAVSFMGRYSDSTREVAQDGRRGALMLSMHAKHPDIFDFVKVKRDLTKVTGANISTKLPDDFMSSVKHDEDYILKWPVNEDEVLDAKEYQHLPYGELVSQKDGSHLRRIKGADLWAEIITSAWSMAEPGLFFMNNHWNYSPDGVYKQYRGITTNPCGEIFMQPYDACRLIAINLFSFIVNPFIRGSRFDFTRFKKVVYAAMRMSDNLVDLELEHIDRILAKIDADPEDEEVKLAERNLWLKVRKTAAASRRTGLGFTGLGDMLAALGMKYDSKEALEFTDTLMNAKMEAELKCTTDLAIIRGTFTDWDANKEFKIVDGKLVGQNRFFQFIVDTYPELANKMYIHGRRNVSWSTVAPTGSLSMLAQLTSGMEPVFQWGYMRRKKINPNDTNVRVDFVDETGDSWQNYAVIHHKLKDWICSNNILTKPVELLTKEEVEEFYKKSPYFESTANDIDWIKRVEMQAVIQKYTSHSISSTINLPQDVTKEEVSEIYMKSWELGLKGITVYREGSRSGVLVNEDTNKDEINKFGEHHAPKRPKKLDAKLVRFNNNKEKWIAFVGLLDSKPYEIFTGKVDDIQIPNKIESGTIIKYKSNGESTYSFEFEGGSIEGINKVFNNEFWNYGRLISGVLRHGMPLHFTVDMINSLKFDEDHINVWKAGVQRALKKFIPDGKAEGLKCQEPECGGSNVIFEEGCSKCLDCGSSKCG
jgi:ribonucleoside-diphosphate reductase alpha chain